MSTPATTLVTQPTAMPGRKLVIGTGGAALLAPHLITLLEMAGITIPMEVAMWIGQAVAFGWAYMTRESE